MNRVRARVWPYGYLVIALLVDALVAGNGQAQTPGPRTTNTSVPPEVIVVERPAVVRIESGQQPHARKRRSKPAPSLADAIMLLAQKISVRPPAERRSDLLNKAQKSFKDLTSSERTLLRAAAEGWIADFGSPSDDRHRCDQPPDRTGTVPITRQNGAAKCKVPQPKPDERGCIGTDLLQWLLTNEDIKPDLDPRGLFMKKAHIGKVASRACQNSDVRLNLEHMVLTAPLTISDSTFDGDVDLQWAQTRTLDFSGSTMRRLDAQRLRIEKGDLILQCATTELGVELSDADIDGAINAGCAVLQSGTDKRDNQPPSADHRDNRSGDEECRSYKYSFNARHLTTHDQVEFRNASSDTGFNLQGAKIGGNLILKDVNITRAWSKRCPVLKLSFANIAGTLLWTPNISKPSGGDGCNHKQPGTPGIDLTYAKVTSFVDSPNSWPEQNDLKILGFTYDNINTTHRDGQLGEFDAVNRRDWLRRQSRADQRVKQPYLQLSSVLQRLGADYDAQGVLIDSQFNLSLEHACWAGGYLKDRFCASDADAKTGQDSAAPSSYQTSFWTEIKRSTIYNVITLAYDMVIWLVVGFGYQPQRALFIGMILFATGAVIFWYGYRRGCFTATLNFADQLRSRAPSREGRSKGNDAPARPGEDEELLAKVMPGEGFSASIFSLEALLPVANLGQRDKWRPDPKKKDVWIGWLVAKYVRVLQIAGWALGALYVAGAATLLWFS
jgi:hypothetical protein